MANSEMTEKILNKQFKKTAFAGYETVDVDSFFDLVIDYLKANDKDVEEYKKQLDKAHKINQDLAKEIKSLQQQLAIAQAQVLKYEAEGYSNVIANKRMADIEKDIKELKNGKQNNK